MKKYILTILLTSMLIISGCGKDDDENSLTAPSTNGKGTLSFLLDGKVWRPKTSFNFPNRKQSHGMGMEPIEYDSIQNNKTNELISISINAFNEDKYHLFMIKIDSVLFEGKYKIKEVLFNTGFDQNFNRFDTLSSSNFVNLTKIHRDYKPFYVDEHNIPFQGQYTTNSYVSGTFSITLINRFGDTVVITDGRFDLKNKAYLN